MSTLPPLPRSPELMSADDTGLLVVDVQARLIEQIPGHSQLVWNIRRLIEAAELLGVSVAATEQYPQGLGPTVPELAALLPAIPAKRAFSCGECRQIFDAWREQGRFRVLLVGIEAHVCVQQTALDLLAAGHRVYLAADAVGSRHAVDLEMALRRLDASGVILTTTEAALFEWCGTSSVPEFKAISRLAREKPPENG